MNATGRFKRPVCFGVSPASFFSVCYLWPYGPSKARKPATRGLRAFLHSMPGMTPPFTPAFVAAL
ncbi:hypothetical protein AA13755_0044 [Acetobacter peroxydans NBRC 13755]|nr:hypothetical protein AA13755_0044 [Acetobacter peroxydans NBRC 13755]